MFHKQIAEVFQCRDFFAHLWGHLLYENHNELIRLYLSEAQSLDKVTKSCDIIKHEKGVFNKVEKNYPPANHGQLIVMGFLASYPFGGIVGRYCIILPGWVICCKLSVYSR